MFCHLIQKHTESNIHFPFRLIRKFFCRHIVNAYMYIIEKYAFISVDVIVIIIVLL